MATAAEKQVVAYENIENARTVFHNAYESLQNIQRNIKTTAQTMLEDYYKGDSAQKYEAVFNEIDRNIESQRTAFDEKSSTDLRTWVDQFQFAEDDVAQVVNSMDTQV